MENQARALVSKSVPWSRDVRWEVVAIEAAVLIGVGAFMLLDTDTASDVVLQVIGVGLLAASALLTLGSLRGAEAGLGFLDAFRAGVGVTCGAIATASWWSDYIENHAVRIILGWGLVAWTVLHVVGLVTVRGRGNIRVSTIVIAGLSLVLGILLLTGNDTTSSDRLNLLGVILLAFGALLVALAWFLFSRNRSVGAGAVDPTAAR